MDQGVEFGVLQIVDIALKAISPAVNDPTTAITCLANSAASLCARPPASHQARYSATPLAASGS
jgi:uncharacterized membrane protein